MVHARDLGLSTVDINDGSYSKTNIYAVNGFPGSNDGTIQGTTARTNARNDQNEPHLPG